MAKRLLSIVILNAAGACLLYDLYLDYGRFISVGRPLGWFALECVLLGAVILLIVVISRGSRATDFEAITGFRAVVGSSVVIALGTSGFVVGYCVDDVLGRPNLRFTLLLTSCMLAVARRAVGILESRFPARPRSIPRPVDTSESVALPPPPN